MSKLQKTFAVGASSLLAVGGVAGAVMAIPQADASEAVAPADAAAEAPAEVSADTGVVYLEKVDGSFQFTQDQVNSNKEIQKFIGDASKYMCQNKAVNDEVTMAEDWTITIQGDVQNTITANYEELLNSDEVQKVLMACICKANPADGVAAINAEVSGLPFSTLLSMAAPEAGANTVVFTSADGYSIALPMDHVINHGGLIVFDINGAPLVDSIGGMNQLWMGSTSANYFARDIVSITLEVRDEAPAAPGTPEAGDDYANLPNVGIAFGGEVE